MASDRNELRRELRARFPRSRGQLLPALHYLHHDFGYLPGWAMEVVGWHLGIPSSEVYGAATSYSELRTEQPGASVVRVCTALSCAVAGGREVLRTLSETLGVSPGSTTEDGQATLEEVPCAFMCALAPALQVDGNWYGRVDADSAARIVTEAARV